MIKGRSEYRFVTGDIDKVVIDGGIMPLRHGSSKSILRGEDIAFLLECSCERMNARGSGAEPVTDTFSRLLLASQPSRVSARMAGMFASRMWAKDDATWVVKTDDGRTWQDIYHYNFLGASDRDGSDDTFASGDAVMLDPIGRLFGDMAKLVKFIGGANSYVSPSNWNVSEIHVDPGEGETPSPFAPPAPSAGDVILYHMDSWKHYWPQQSSGSVKYESTDAAVTVAVNEFARRVMPVARYAVSDLGEDGVPREFAAYVPLGWRSASGGTVTVGNSSIVSGAYDALSHLGVTLRPYPGSQTFQSQDCRVSASPAFCVCELRDRTRW